MNPLDIIHSSFNPILEYLYQEPLITLNNKILPEISFQPAPNDIFKVFRMPLKDIKVVLLGQDPYSTPGDAVGLSFVNGADKVPPSLRVIYREILNSTGKEGDIKSWEQQGVFLLNTSLTVETGKPLSHSPYWKPFIINVIKYISFHQPCIWFLWGKAAQSFQIYIYHPFDLSKYNNETIMEVPVTNDYNYIFRAPHPASEVYSGGSSGFYGCNHFIYSNIVLIKLRKTNINW